VITSFWLHLEEDLPGDPSISNGLMTVTRIMIKFAIKIRYGKNG
jgi:hypothetical protein